MGIGRVASRVLKAQFTKKNPLPQKLEFLEGIPFFAITECIPPRGVRKQTRIEVLPKGMKKIVSSYKEYGETQKEISEIKDTLLKAKQMFTEQQEYIEALEKANEQLMRNLGDGPEKPKTIYKSYLQVAEEIGFISHGLPFQGGLPSLGKKS